MNFMDGFELYLYVDLMWLDVFLFEQNPNNRVLWNLYQAIYVGNYFSNLLILTIKSKRNLQLFWE